MQLASTGNATFAGNIIASSTSAVIQTPRISMEADGTLDWGQARDYGTLTWDTGYAVMKGQTSKGLYFQVNNNSTDSIHVMRLLSMHDPDFQSFSAKHASQVELYLLEQSKQWFDV